MDFETYMIIADIENSLAIPVIILVLIRFGEKSNYVKLIGLFALMSIVTHVLQAKILTTSWGVNACYNIYVIVENTLLALIYIGIFESRKATKIILITLSAYLVFSAINFIFIQGVASLGSYNDTIGSFLLLTVAIVYLYQLVLGMEPERRIATIPAFWFNLAILILNAGSFLLFLITEYLVNVVKSDLTYYWTFFNLLRAFHFILIIMAVWMDLRTREVEVAVVK